MTVETPARGGPPYLESSDVLEGELMPACVLIDHHLSVSAFITEDRRVFHVQDCQERPVGPNGACMRLHTSPARLDHP